VVRAINPWPVFDAFAKTASHRVHQDVTDLLLFLVVIAQAMIKEIALPFYFLVSGQEMFPVGHTRFHALLARESDDAVEVIGHEEHQPAVPDELIMIVGQGGEDRVTNSGAAKLVWPTRSAVDGDEEARTFRQPKSEFRVEVVHVGGDSWRRFSRLGSKWQVEINRIAKGRARFAKRGAVDGGEEARTFRQPKP
jgi:hypothetical protein